MPHTFYKPPYGVVDTSYFLRHSDSPLAGEYLEANRRIQITKTELAISALFGFTHLYFLPLPKQRHQHSNIKNNYSRAQSGLG